MQRPGTMPTALQDHRRPVPYYLQPDYKIHEFNKRLQHRTDKVEQVWWDELISEFFEDDAVLAVQYKDKSHQRKYTIHRRLIPRYFRSLFGEGVSKVYFLVFDTKENYMNSTVTLDCKHASMVTHYTKPADTEAVNSLQQQQNAKEPVKLPAPTKQSETKIQTDGHLLIEFSFDEFMRIRNWKFQVKENTELIPRSILKECEKEQSKLDEFKSNVTESGFCASTLQHLRIGVILEPMQELMSRQKSSGMNPRDSLKSVLYDKWQAQILSQDFEQRPRIWSGGRRATRGGAAKRRKPRKSPSVSEAKTSKKKPPSTSTFPSLTTSDVMLVDEPMLMGGKFGDKDQRVITRLSHIHRLENTQFSNNNGSAADDVDETFTQSGGMERPAVTDTQLWKNVTPKEEKKTE